MAYVIRSGPRPLIGRKGLIQLVLFGGIVTLIGLPYIGAALRYLYPAHGESGQTETYPLSSLTFNGPVAGPVVYEFTPGQGDYAGVYIVKSAGGGVIGLEQTCTHLGCPIAWNESANQFQCPCHGSRFNTAGQVVGGPAPLPLYKHEVEISGDTVTVKGRI